MKYTIIIIWLFLSSIIKAQSDTIEITQFKSTQLIFNEDITFVEAGTGDLQVKTKIVDNILIIQSIAPLEDFKSTNLFIKTATNIYNPILKYSAKPTISTILANNMKSAISNQTINYSKTATPSSTSANASVQKGFSFNDPTNEEKKIIETITNYSDQFKPSREYTTGVWFRFLAHYINHDKFYMKINIDNTSDLNYNLDNFFFSVKSTKKRNATETQRAVIPIKIITPMEVIEANTSKIIIFEFNSFSINKDEEFLIELKEKNGARNFVVGVPYYIINQPLPLNK